MADKEVWVGCPDCGGHPGWGRRQGKWVLSPCPTCHRTNFPGLVRIPGALLIEDGFDAGVDRMVEVEWETTRGRNRPWMERLLHAALNEGKA